MANTDVIPGAKTTFDSTAGFLMEVEDSLTILKDKGDGISFLKRIGIGKPVNSYKHTWYERNRTLSQETITVADGSTTAITVLDTAVYKVGDILHCEAEKMRVTARTNATTLAVTRAYAGTTGAAHTAKVMYNLGLAEAEGADAPQARSGVPTPIYNYVETFAESAELPWQVIAEAQAGGNPMTTEIADTTAVFWRRLWHAVLFGKRYEDTTNALRTMGGIEQYLVSNKTTVGGAVTKAALNAELLQIVESASGNVGNLVILCSPYQKSKIDALDASLVATTYGEKVTGTNDIEGYKTGIGLGVIPFIVDVSIPKDKIYILDTDKMELKPQVNNGINGRASLYDATTPGKAHQKKVLRGLYTFELKSELTGSILEGLS